MALIEWSSSYSVGIKALDEEHRRLLDIVNSLYEAMMEGTGRDVVEDVLAAMSRYAGTHFANEQQLLEAHGYPAALAHQYEHEKLMKQVDDLKREVREDRSSAVVHKCARFLKDWLVNHIQGTDKEYSQFLKDKGVS